MAPLAVGLQGTIDLPNGGMVVAAFAVAVIVAVIVIAIVIVDRRGLELDVDGKALKFSVRRRAPSDAKELRYKAAMQRLGDLEQGLAALPNATEAALARWFTNFCENTAWVLSVGTHLHYRIALWSDDDSDTTILRKVALHGFDRNDTRMEQLDRASTVAGWCANNGKPYYVRDTEKDDPVFRPRRSKPSYRSLYAVPLGTWAVLTADVDVDEGFAEDQTELIERFGRLATTAATLAAPPAMAAATSGGDDPSGHADVESVYIDDGRIGAAEEGGQP